MPPLPHAGDRLALAISNFLLRRRRIKGERLDK
jgi:hypothetical protein